MLPNFSPAKSIVFVHDLTFKMFPQAYSVKDKLILDQSFKRALKAAVIIFISENTKKDFLKFYPSFKGQTHVIYPGYNKEIFRPNKNSRDVFNLNSSYILYVGRLESRKNITNLIRAYSIFRKSSKLTPKLVLAGKEGYKYHEIEAEIKKLDARIKNDIVIPGYIPENDIGDLYTGASLFVFPSYYEGFGIPILEAAACGIPVICSKSSSLPEAGGNAVQYFDPDNYHQIAKMMDEIFNNTDLHRKLSSAGIYQAKKFSYKKMAGEVTNIINSI